MSFRIGDGPVRIGIETSRIALPRTNPDDRKESPSRYWICDFLWSADHDLCAVTLAFVFLRASRRIERRETPRNAPRSLRAASAGIAHDTLNTIVGANRPATVSSLSLSMAAPRTHPAKIARITATMAARGLCLGADLPRRQPPTERWRTVSQGRECRAQVTGLAAVEGLLAPW